MMITKNQHETSPSEMRKSTVDYYLRLQSHRIMITEGIRLVARRNNSHMFRLQSKLRSSITPGRLGYDQIQNAILEDQGVEQNRINRAVLQFATWMPWEVYFSLLSEELRAYKHAATGGMAPRSKELDDFLHANSTVISKLSKFRDKILHPESGQSSGQLYPEHFGDLIDIYYKDFDTIVEAQYLMDMHLATLELRRTKARTMGTLAGQPLSLINDWQDQGEIHTPMPSRMIWPCLEALAGIVQTPDSAQQKQPITTYAKVGYLMMLVRFSVLMHETIHQLFFMGKSDAEMERQVEYISAPMKVGMALLQPGLKKYEKMASTNAGLRNDLLQEFTSDVEFMSVLTRFRNAIFHVPRHTVDIEGLSHRILDLSKKHAKLEDVSSALLDFFRRAFKLQT